MKYLIALDFDFTTIDEDSDMYILKQLSPDLIEPFKQSKMQWTDLCHHMAGELHSKGFKETDIRNALHTIPFNPAMKEFFELVHGFGNEIIIISDANHVYIDTISKAKNIHHYISHVVTNPAHFDDTGRLCIKWYSTDSHNCPNSCSLNLCKGRELNAFIGSKEYDRIVYIGDGRNDFCPSTKLRKQDLVLVRKGMGFAKKLQNPQDRKLIEAELIEWDTADEILTLFTKLMK
ncbi:phosphatase phospho-type, partial [Globomyces pollinis-pini]